MTQSAKRAFQVGDKVRWSGSGGWEVVLAVTSAHAFLVDASVGDAAVFRVPLSELTLVESAPSEPGKSTDLLYGWERCSHEGIGKPGCSTCDPDKSRCVAKLERDLAQRDETIAELRKAQAAWLASPEAAKRLEGYRELGAKCADLEGQLQASRAKSEQRREAHVPKYSTTSSWRPTWDELVAERNALKAEVARYEADALLLRRMFSEDERKLKAEVERLKAEAQAKMSGKFYVMSDAEVVTIEGLQADVGRLTGERDALKAEVERLKNERAVIDDRVMNGEAENAKLREALQRCAAQLADWRDASEVKYPGDRKALDMAAALGVKVTS